MIHLPFASGKKYAVLGLGKSGRATVASLLSSGAEVTAWDDGEAARVAAQKEFGTLKLLPPDAWDVSECEALLMSPGIMLNHPAVRRAQAAGIEVIGDIELLYRACPAATYVAITGTNGKSTTTSLIAHILSASGKRVQVGGNLGIAALSLEPLSAGGIYVLELSSYQLELVNTTRFNTAVFLNLSPDHIDHHGSMENYISAKQHIFDRQQSEDIAILGVDDCQTKAITSAMMARSHQRIIPISAAQKLVYGVDVEAGALRAVLDNHRQSDISAIRSLQGQHNWQNAAAAYAACRVNGCSHEEIMAAMQHYPGLPHRMQWLGTVHGVHFVNDSKATNADAAEKALKTYDTIYWILGGVAKEGGIESLAPYFAKIKHAYLIGEAADDFATTLEGKVIYTRCETLENAFHAASLAASLAAMNGASVPCVMLAPACASFDQYANFEKRGEAFVALVEQWKQGGGIHATTA